MIMSSASRSQVSEPFARAPSETPMTHVKISTPPRSTFGKRPHSTLDTPVRVPDSAPKTLLLSPAFSSPQPPQPPVFEKRDVVHGSYFAHSGACDSSSFAHAAKVTKSFSDSASEPFSEPIDESFNDSFGDGFGASTSMDLKDPTNPKGKKPKKLRRDPREANFSLASSEKPPYSYATLIGMSILSNPEKQLTLSQIYSWISDTFKYYRREDVGWQNSIRHNLSLNKAFVKGEKSKDGKGHFWCIQSDSEDLFLKSRNNKKSSYHEVMDQLASAKNHTHSLIPSSPTSLTDDDSLQFSSSKAPQLSSITNIHPAGSDLPSVEVMMATQDAEPQSQSLLLRTPGRIPTSYDSPEKPILAGKNLGFTSSFSCSSNFELSPLPAHGTGPLLEPLSPRGNGLVAQTLGNLSVQLPTISVSQTNSHHHRTPSGAGFGTPKAAGTARTTPKASGRTPLRILRTPLSGAMLSKLRNSPSYLEDFYHSPFISGRAVFNSYDDDDMLLRAFDSPGVHQTPRPSLLGELKKATLEHTSETSSKQQR